VLKNNINNENPNEVFPQNSLSNFSNTKNRKKKSFRIRMLNIRSYDIKELLKNALSSVRGAINEFGMHILDYIGYNLLHGNKVIVTTSPYFFPLRLLLSIRSGTCLVRNIDRIKGKYRERYDTHMFAEWNEKREGISKIVGVYAEDIKDEFERITTKMIPILIPTACLEKWEEHEKERYAILEKRPLACFDFCNEIERAKYAEVGGKIITTQHSFAYEVFPEIASNISERSIAQHRVTWGRKVEPWDIPMEPWKVVYFANEYVSERKRVVDRLDRNTTLPLLWMPTPEVPPGYLSPTDMFDTLEDNVDYLAAVLSKLEKNA